ncbi:hypothetical protein, partial [Escherichia coli]
MSVPVQHPMYIDGQFVTWRGDAWIDVVNPARGARRIRKKSYAKVFRAS